MMAFTVQWAHQARNEYMLAWFMARNRVTVEAAEATINDRLAADPQANGTHVAEGLWKIAVPPLLVHFEIDAPANNVNVTQLDLLTETP